jgi:DNA-binding HxlR family transcriptional regulator
MAVYQKKLPTVLNNGLGLFFEVMSGKWKAFILFYIQSGSKRPGELQRKIPEADRRVLDNQLTELVNHGLISKTVYDTKPPKVEYELTDLGKSLLPLICDMHQWGEDHMQEVETNKTKSI